jgi:hypothetical protein
MTDRAVQPGAPTTKAGRVLLEQEAYNSRSFPLITVEAILAIEAEARAASQPLSQERPQPDEESREQWLREYGAQQAGLAQERPPIDVLREVEDVIMSEPWWPRAGAIRRRAVMEKIRARLSRSVASPEPSDMDEKCAKCSHTYGEHSPDRCAAIGPTCPCSGFLHRYSFPPSVASPEPSE